MGGKSSHNEGEGETKWKSSCAQRKVFDRKPTSKPLFCGSRDFVASTVVAYKSIQCYSQINIAK